jgi:hypothetical protein
MAEDDAADEEHLAQVAQGQPVAQAPQHHQGDRVRGVLGVVQPPALRSLNCLPQSRQRNRR